ncbi:hypothetical protein ACSBR1_001221 [Camellia fascicularis]
MHIWCLLAEDNMFDKSPNLLKLFNLTPTNENENGDILFLHMSKDPIRAGEIVVFNVDVVSYLIWFWNYMLVDLDSQFFFDTFSACIACSVMDVKFLVHRVIKVHECQDTGEVDVLTKGITMPNSEEPIPVTQLVRKTAAVMQEFTQSGLIWHRFFWERLLLLNPCLVAKDHCGNFSIPYPFGTSKECYIEKKNF